MSDDGKGTPKKQWKAFNVSYEFVVAASDGCCTYALTNQQVAALLSMTEYLRWPTRWVKSSSELDRDFTNDFTDDLERALMNGCCPDSIPTQYRYNEDGELERSIDGGNSWFSAPQYDVRNNSTQFPPIAGDDGDDKKCQAAGAMVVALELQVTDQLTDDMSSITLGELIESWVTTYHETSNPFITILTVAVNQIFALGIALLRLAITDEVYDTLRCIFYCNMLDNGSFDNTGWIQVKADIYDQIGGIAGLFFGHLVDLLGYGGLTNMARSGYDSDEDCGDCGCTDCVCSFEDWILSGTFVSCDGLKVVVEAQESGGVYSVYMGYGGGNSYNVDMCRQVYFSTTLSGTILSTGYNECHTGTLHFGFLSVCGSQHFWTSNVPFTVEIEYTSCEDCG